MCSVCTHMVYLRLDEVYFSLVYFRIVITKCLLSLGNSQNKIVVVCLFICKLCMNNIAHSSSGGVKFSVSFALYFYYSFSPEL